MDDTKEIKCNIPEEYDEAFVTTDNRVIAFDESIGAWVQLKGINE